jgi:hypothetical protein
MYIPTNASEELKRDGVLILPSLLDGEVISKIKKDISSCITGVSFNNHLASFIVGENQWIEHLSLHSKNALEIALNTNLLNLIDSFFGEKAILGSLKFQKKILKTKPIPLHRDRGPGLVLFIFLNEINKDVGATRFLKGTHLSLVENKLENFKKDDADYFRSESFDFENSCIEAKGGGGTVQIYSQKILHDLPAVQFSGRETVWAIYYPKSKSHLSDNHIFSHNTLINLSEFQKERILFDQEALGLCFTKTGNSKSLLDDYKIPKWKMFLYIFRFYLLTIINFKK